MSILPIAVSFAPQPCLRPVSLDIVANLMAHTHFLYDLSDRLIAGERSH